MCYFSFLKKRTLIVVLSFVFFNLYSQINKEDILFSINGSYVKSTNSNGVSSNYSNTEGKYLTTGTSLKIFITDRFYAAIGLDYNWNKESRTNGLYLNNYAQIENMKIKSYVYLPNIACGYHYPIINNLYVNTISVPLKLKHFQLVI
jgi:hypothetical protein